MPYEISWYIENRILYSRWWGTVEMPELNDSRYKAEKLLKGIDASQVHTIIDMTQTDDFKVNIFQVNQDAQPNEQLTVVGGWMIYVGVSRVTKFLIQIGATIARMRYRTFETLPEALAFLEEIDPTLKPLMTVKKT